MSRSFAAGLCIMEALWERKTKLSHEVADLGKQVRRARSKEEAATSKAARTCVLTSTVLRTVLFAYVLADGDPDTAVVFLRGKGSQLGWADETDEEIEALIDQVYMAAGPWNAAAPTNAGDTPDKLRQAVPST